MTEFRGLRYPARSRPRSFRLSTLEMTKLESLAREAGAPSVSAAMRGLIMVSSPEDVARGLEAISNVGRGKGAKNGNG